MTQKKYLLLAFESALEIEEGKNHLVFLEGRMKDANERFEKDQALLVDTNEKITNAKASGSGITYKDRKQLEFERDQHIDNIAGLKDLMHGKRNKNGQLIENGYDQYIMMAKSSNEQKKVQVEKYLRLAELATKFTM